MPEYSRNDGFDIGQYNNFDGELSKIVTIDMAFGAGVGWRIAHDQLCPQGPFCSAHNSIDSKHNQEYLYSVLALELDPRR